MAEEPRTDLIKSVKERSKSLEGEMSFFAHLEVLRWHLIRASIAVVVFTTLAWIYYDFLYNDIIMAPKHANFWTYRMMCRLSENFPSLFSDYCISKDIPFTIINNEMAGQFTLQMNSSLLAGILLGIPYLLYEIWRFIKPGLKDTERNAANGFVFYATLLFLVGVLFGYYIITPLSINFLANYIISPDIVNNITINSYLSTVGTLTIGSGIIFELPIIIFILSKMGMMTPKFMRSSRRYAAVLILIIAAIVTPTPDILTMIAVAFPLFLLYELSISVSARVERRRKKAETDFYSGA